jgi:hypothetical protein
MQNLGRQTKPLNNFFLKKRIPKQTLGSQQSGPEEKNDFKAPTSGPEKQHPEEESCSLELERWPSRRLRFACLLACCSKKKPQLP